MEELGVALDVFLTSLSIRRALLGSTHRDVATILYNIATVQLASGDEDEALKTFEETLRVERSALGVNDLGDIVITLRHIAQILKARGNLDEALAHLNEALCVQSRIVGAADDNVIIGQILNQMGNIHLQRCETKKAMELYCRSLRIFRKAGRTDSEMLIEGLNFYNMAVCHPEAAPQA
mmetsp:Transcript_20361/g.31012  ORF Transcript_20361/g.31012 Transcript_20361/m.31012 type:complete len:179 (-) Transcript_20361:328-864(-)